MGKLEEKKVLDSLFFQAISKKSIKWIFLFILLTALLGASFYDLIKVLFKIVVDFDKTIEELLAVLLVVVLSFFSLWWLSDKFLKLKNEYTENDAVDIDIHPKAPKKVLVVFLSNLNPNNEEAKMILLSDKASIEAKMAIYEKTAWRMPYAAIDFHKSTLQRLYVLTSQESTVEYEPFKTFINEKFGKRGFSIEELFVKDIQNPEIMKEHFHTIYTESKSYDPSEIVIDVTSGTKLYSIAGSYFSLHSKRIIEYVTIENEKPVVYQFNDKIIHNDDVQ